MEAAASMRYYDIKKVFYRIITYLKSHIWVQLLFSVILLSSAFLFVFNKYLENLYYNNLIEANNRFERSILSASANSLNYILANELKIGGEIAVNSDLYESVHRTIHDDNSQIIVDLRNLQNIIKGIVGYSEDIAAISVVSDSGLIYEYGRYWIGNVSDPLWVGDNGEIIKQMYPALIAGLGKGAPGYYHVSTEPLWKESAPRMNLYHVAYPLLGGYHTFSKVEAAIVISYKMESVAKSGSLSGDTKIENTYRYLTDNEGKIIFHEDEQFIGMNEAEYLSGTNVISQDTELDYFGWKANIATDVSRIRQNVNRIYKTGSTLWIFVLLASCVIWGLMIRSILKPISTIKHSMREIEHGNQEMIQIKGQHEIWKLASEYNSMLESLEEQRKLTAKENNEKMQMSELRLEAEKTALESQINAHFIFNTLNAINYSVIETGNTELMHLIKMFANILQYTLSKDKTVTLGDEFAMAEEYLFLQKFRLMDKFDYEISFPEEYNEWPCCKLFLQPFVENSIVHAFEETETGGIISISGKEEAGRFRVELRDNGCGIDEETLAGIRSMICDNPELEMGKKGVGIKNVIKRLKLFYGKDFCFTLESRKGFGTEYVFWLPIPENMEY